MRHNRRQEDGEHHGHRSVVEKKSLRLSLLRCGVTCLYRTTEPWSLDAGEGCGEAKSPETREILTCPRVKHRGKKSSESGTCWHWEPEEIILFFQKSLLEFRFRPNRTRPTYFILRVAPSSRRITQSYPIKPVGPTTPSTPMT